MDLLPGETVVSVSDNKTVTLTTARLRHAENNKACSILLENIQSINLHYKDHIPLLIAGFVFLIAALSGMLRDDFLIAGSVVPATICFLVYVYTRHHYLTVASSASVINILIKGQKTADMIRFIDLIEEHICKRKMVIHSSITR